MHLGNKKHKWTHLEHIYTETLRVLRWQSPPGNATDPAPDLVLTQLPPFTMDDANKRLRL